MNHFYPGMGATNEMYSGPWRELSDSVFHDWPQPKGETSIEELALRLIVEQGIRKGDTEIGTSLGGMVACEIANQVELEKLVLIGSAVCLEEISRLLKRLHPLVDFAPLQFIHLSARSLPSDLSVMFSRSVPNKSELIFHVFSLFILGRLDEATFIPIGATARAKCSDQFRFKS